MPPFDAENIMFEGETEKLCRDKNRENKLFSNQKHAYTYKIMYTNSKVTLGDWKMCLWN